MAINVTRSDNFMQKKQQCFTVIHVNSDNYKDFNEAGDYLVAHLPPRAIVTDAYVYTFVVSDAGAVTLGSTEGGTEILDLGDTTVLGITGTPSKGQTGTGVPLYMSISAPITSGEFIAVVEYLEYTKNTGEYTRID